MDSNIFQQLDCVVHLAGVVRGDDLQVLGRPLDPAPLEARKDDLLRLAADDLLVVLLAHSRKFVSLDCFEEPLHSLFLFLPELGLPLLLEDVVQDVAEEPLLKNGAV